MGTKTPKNIRLRDDQEAWIKRMKQINPEYNRSNLVRMAIDLLRKEMRRNKIGTMPFMTLLCLTEIYELLVGTTFAFC